MTDLPFEHDSVELIEACAQALAAIELQEKAAARAQTTRTGEETRRGAGTLRLYETSVASAELLPEAPEEIFLRDAPPAHVSSADAEAISRAVERDARRYE